MFSKTHGLILLTLLLLLLSVSSVCAADNVSAVNVSDNVSGNISEANVSETNVFTVSSRCDIWDEHYETQIEVDPYYLSGSNGDIINFAARVYYSKYLGSDGVGPIYGNSRCFGGSVSLHEDGKLIDSIILSNDNDGAAFFSFKFKEGHRYHLEYHGYGVVANNFWERSYIYEGSSKNLSIAILSPVNVSDNVSGNISEANVSANVPRFGFWTEYLDSRVVVGPYYLSGSDGDIIKFFARVYYSRYLEYDGITPIFVSGQCFGGRVSLHEDGKLIKSTILSKDNNGAAFFSFKYKAGHRYRLVYHGYSSPDHGFWSWIFGESYYYMPSSEDLNVDIVSAVNVSDNVSGNISEANVSESNLSANVPDIDFLTECYDTRIVVDPPNLSGSDGDIINFTARVYYSRYNGHDGITPTFRGRVSLYEDGKLIDSVILREDNNGTASFSFMFKEGHRYYLVYHGYSSPDHGFWPWIFGESYYYMPSSKDLNITIVR